MGFAEFGADVAKIENQATGDPYRSLVTQGIGAQEGGDTRLVPGCAPGPGQHTAESSWSSASVGRTSFS